MKKLTIALLSIATMLGSLSLAQGKDDTSRAFWYQNGAPKLDKGDMRRVRGSDKGPDKGDVRRVPDSPNPLLELLRKLTFGK